MNQVEHERLMNFTLEEKIAKSKEIIKSALEEFSRDEIYLAWTGGKDSTTMLWLYREACKDLGKTMPRAMFIDEGHVFEEILVVVDEIKSKWDIDPV